MILDLLEHHGLLTTNKEASAIRNVKVRLDRVVASPDWSNIYPQSYVRHLTSSRSDHCPILLTMEHNCAMGLPSRPRRYEACWEREKNLS
jgi:hypothetical protein